MGNSFNNNKKKINRFLFIFLQWKQKTCLIGTFTFVVSRLYKIHYYSFIHTHWFENYVFVMSARTDVQYYLSSFFFSPARVGSFLFCRLGLVHWKIHSFFVGLVCWKNYLSFVGQAHGKNHLSFASLTCWKNHLSFGSPASEPGPCRPLQYASVCHRTQMKEDL